VASRAAGARLVVEAPGVLANDADADGDALSAVLVTVPAHGELVLASDGSYTYTPAAGYRGTDTFEYVAHDGRAASEPASVSITVTATNRPPAAAGDAYSVDEGQPLTVDAPGVLANDSDPDGDRLRAVLASGPSEGQFDLAPDGSFTYTPGAGFEGADSFTYTAGDGTAESEPVTVTITVLAVNHPPVAGGEAYTTRWQEPLVVGAPGVLANDADPDGDGLAAVLASGPAHGALALAGDGSFSYTPADGFSGTDTFSYVASDGAAFSNPVAVTIVVSPPVGRTLSVSDAPVVAESGGRRSSGYAEFVVSLSSPSSAAVTVRASTVDGTAVAGTDYRARTVDLRFAPGTTSKTVKVEILGDQVTEPEEQFSLVLTGPRGASILDGSAIGTIAADELPPVLSVSGTTVVTEPTGRRSSVEAEFVVSLSSAASSAVMVRASTVDGTAVAGDDYRAKTVDLRFAPGTTVKTVKVSILSDQDDEPDEQFLLVLGEADGATIGSGIGVATIRDTR
jgi:VCBS repeat-containing protein